MSENNEKALLLNLSSTKVGVIAQIALPKSFHCCFRSSFRLKTGRGFIVKNICQYFKFQNIVLSLRIIAACFNRHLQH